MKEPADRNEEYIMIRKSVVYAGHERVKIRAGTVVINLHYAPVGGMQKNLSETILGGSSQLHFTVKSTGENFNTNYGWLFARNSPQNLIRLERWRLAESAAQQAREIADLMFNEMETVAGPSDGTFSGAP